jgi:DNA polymerase-3 subunit gamma/tau
VSYEVVARRWRPATFAQLVGQPHVAETLGKAIERDRLPHAFLFTGVRGVGKTTVARLLAKALNCTARNGAEPCNECPSCTAIIKGSSVDVIEIDGASNRKIEDIRELIENSQYSPAGSRFKVYIIDEVHQLTKDAFNALLKTLEEPPAHCKFIMATTEAHKLMPTVLSRCQRYDFRRLSEPEISKQLAHIVKTDELSIAAGALALIAHEADGSMRDAQSLLEQVLSGSDGEIGAEEAALLLGVAGQRRTSDCLRAIVGRQPGAVVDVVTELREFGADCEKFLGDVLELLRHQTVAAAAGPKSLDPLLSDATKEIATELAPLRDPLDLQRIFSVLLGTLGDLRRDLDPFLVLEMGLLKAACLHDVASSAEILARLEAVAAGGRSSGPSGSSGSSNHSPAASRPAPSNRGGGRQASASSPAPAASAPRAAPAQPSAQPSAPAQAAAPARTPDQASSKPATAAPASTVPASTVPGSAVPASAGAPGDLHQWEIFLDDVRSRLSMEIYFALISCELISQSETILEIRPKANGMAQGLAAPKVLREISDVAQDHFGPSIEVRMAGRGAMPAPISKGPAAPKPAPPAKAAPAPRPPQAVAAERSVSEPVAAPVTPPEPEPEPVAAAPEPPRAPPPPSPPSREPEPLVAERPMPSDPESESMPPPHGEAPHAAPAPRRPKPPAPEPMRATPPSPDAPISAQGLEDERKKRKEAEAVADPIVQTAINELGGEVRQIKPLND